ncbi:MAG: type II toxin-antitoxin system VapC family toxin [Roseburia sp.]|nr:type II toxin-antitoxin system VapC family toxin [Roseburia sp.]
MNCLADTHILIRALKDDPKLSAKAREILLNKDNSIYYSFANVWEVAIKHALHKSSMTFSAQGFEKLCGLAGYIPLETSFRHAYMVETLKYADSAPREHRDPFDRLLLAQAKAENMYFLTHDELIPFYDESCIVSV